MKLKIEKLIYEGWGIGHDESGRAVFVKKSVPGDILEVNITKQKKNFAEAVIDKIVEPSTDRVEAPCPYFERCGGCEHQNIAYENQLKYKESIFRETLSRAKIKTEILPIVQASAPFYYRNSIRFFLVQNPDGKKILTRHDYRNIDDLIEAKTCMLQSEKSNEILNSIIEVLNANDDKLDSLYQIKIRDGKFTGDYMVELITDHEHLPHEKELKQALKKFPEIKSLYHTITFKRSLRDVRRRLLFGSPIIFEKIGKYAFQISPDSFFQTNSLGVKTLYDKIKEFTTIEMGETVLDLFCGTGTIGIYLATLAKKVVGIEVVQAAINDALINAKLNKISNVEFIRSDANNWLYQNKDAKFDKIIVDPPRAGLTKDLISDLSKLSTPDSKLIYVSCNPATFARDILEFEKLGLKLKKVQPLDMFPQTHHLECVGVISR